MNQPIDRRKFLTYTGAVGAATGALWVAPSVVGSSSAFALNSNSSCTYDGKVVWSPTTGNPWTDGSWVAGDLDGASRPVDPSTSVATTFTAKVGGNGNSYVYVKFTVTPHNSPDPVTGNPNFPGISPTNANDLYGNMDSWYRMAWTTDASSTTGFDLTVEFFSDSGLSNPATVENLTFSILDFDGSTSSAYQDQAYLTSSSAFTATEHASVTGTGTSLDPWTTPTTPAPVASNSTAGNVDVTFATVSSFTLKYTNDTTYTGGTNGLAIGDLDWHCI